MPEYWCHGNEVKLLCALSIHENSNDKTIKIGEVEHESDAITIDGSADINNYEMLKDKEINF